jgi:C-terminal processing protease CtpA/Prc
LHHLIVEAGSDHFDLTADNEVGYYPRLPVPIPGIQDNGTVSWTRLRDGIGYIYVRRIRNDLETRLDKAVAALKGVRGMILDVRGNSGGGSDSSIALVNFMLDHPEIQPERPRYRGPIALLTDALCCSAGEGWASWFIATRRARTFGQATAGTSSAKETFPVKNGLYRVRLSIKPYTGFLDRPIERRGLEPNVPLMPNARDLAAGRDTVLEAAKAWLASGAGGDQTAR